MTALITELLNEGMTKRSKILLIKENQRNPAWIKICLPTADVKYTFEAALKEKRDKKPKLRNQLRGGTATLASD